MIFVPGGAAVGWKEQQVGAEVLPGQDGDHHDCRPRHFHLGFHQGTCIEILVQYSRLVG